MSKKNTIGLISGIIGFALIIFLINFFYKKISNDNKFEALIEQYKITDSLDYNSFNELADKNYYKAYYYRGLYNMFVVKDSMIAKINFQRAIDEGDELNGNYGINVLLNENKNWLSLNLSNLENIAEKDWSWAKRLASCFYRGDGVNQDFTKAFYFYKISSELGCSISKYKLAMMLFEGKGTEVNQSLAFNYLSQLVDVSYDFIPYKYQDKVCFKVGYMYLNGLGTDINLQKASDLITKSANMGNSEAMCDLGYFYSLDNRFTSNYSESINWYNKSIEKGNTRAMLSLGKLYESGIGVDQDYEKAKSLYNQALEKGNSNAEVFLSNINDRINNNYNNPQTNNSINLSLNVENYESENQDKHICLRCGSTFTGRGFSIKEGRIISGRKTYYDPLIALMAGAGDDPSDFGDYCTRDCAELVWKTSY